MVTFAGVRAPSRSISHRTSSGVSESDFNATISCGAANRSNLLKRNRIEVQGMYDIEANQISFWLFHACISSYVASTTANEPARAIHPRCLIFFILRCSLSFPSPTSQEPLVLYHLLKTLQHQAQYVGLFTIYSFHSHLPSIYQPRCIRPGPHRVERVRTPQYLMLRIIWMRGHIWQIFRLLSRQVNVLEAVQ